MNDTFAKIGLIGILVTGYMKITNFSPELPEFKFDKETISSSVDSTLVEASTDTVSSISWEIRYWTLANNDPQEIRRELLTGAYTMYDPAVIETEYKALDKSKFSILTKEEIAIALANGDSSVPTEIPVSLKLKIYYEKIGTNPNWILLFDDKEQEMGYLYFPDVKHLFAYKDLYVESE